MSRHKADKVKAETKTLALRLPLAKAEEVEREARACGLTTSGYLSDMIKARTRQALPSVHALGEVLALVHALRADPNRAQLVAQLLVATHELCAAARAELGPRG